MLGMSLAFASPLASDEAGTPSVLVLGNLLLLCCHSRSGISWRRTCRSTRFSLLESCNRIRTTPHCILRRWVGKVLNEERPPLNTTPFQTKGSFGVDELLGPVLSSKGDGQESPDFRSRAPLAILGGW